MTRQDKALEHRPQCRFRTVRHGRHRTRVCHRRSDSDDASTPSWRLHNPDAGNDFAMHVPTPPDERQKRYRGLHYWGQSHGCRRLQFRPDDKAHARWLTLSARTSRLKVGRKVEVENLRAVSVCLHHPWLPGIIMQIHIGIILNMNAHWAVEIPEPI